MEREAIAAWKPKPRKNFRIVDGVRKRKKKVYKPGERSGKRKGPAPSRRKPPKTDEEKKAARHLAHKRWWLSLPSSTASSKYTHHSRVERVRELCAGCEYIKQAAISDREAECRALLLLEAPKSTLQLNRKETQNGSKGFYFLREHISWEPAPADAWDKLSSAWVVVRDSAPPPVSDAKLLLEAAGALLGEPSSASSRPSGRARGVTHRRWWDR
jgi:hypothetical protein